jgi:hypothetical protein
MTWTSLATVTLSRAWQFSELTESTYFRLRQEAPSYDYGFRISQFDDNSLLIGPEIVLGAESQVLDLSPPPLMNPNRRIGLRVYNRARVPAAWTVILEESDAMPIANPVTATVTFPSAAAATSTTVAAATVTTAIVAANANRKGLTIFNNSTARLYLDHDASVSATDFAVLLEAGGFYEVPREYAPLAMSGIWTAVNGNCLVREFV